MPNKTSTILEELLEESFKEEHFEPTLYNVLLLNDEYTPMDFVVELLLRYFNLSEEKATEIMLNVHHMGKAVCGTFSKDVASTKVEQVNSYALQNQHPLKCIISEN